MNRVHRWFVPVVALVAIGALSAIAVAMARPITSGAVSITGSGTVDVTGRVIVRGVLNGSRPTVEIQTMRSSARFSSGGKFRTIGRGQDVRVRVTPNTFFGIVGTGANMRVELRGSAMLVAVAGTATIEFSGNGSYTPAYGATARWPRGSVELRQPRTNAVYRRTHPGSATAQPRIS